MIIVIHAEYLHLKMCFEREKHFPMDWKYMFYRMKAGIGVLLTLCSFVKQHCKKNKKCNTYQIWCVPLAHLEHSIWCDITPFLWCVVYEECTSINWVSVMNIMNELD